MRAVRLAPSQSIAARTRRTARRTRTVSSISFRFHDVDRRVLGNRRAAPADHERELARFDDALVPAVEQRELLGCYDELHRLLLARIEMNALEAGELLLVG